MEALRQVPPTNDIWSAPELAPYRHMIQTPLGTRLLNAVVSDIKREITSSRIVESRVELKIRIAGELADRLARAVRPSLRRVINASGVVLHTNLGRAPLPAAALEHIRIVSAGYSNLEYDIDEGGRGVRDTHVDGTIAELLGCEGAVIVNNNAAAVLLILNTLAECGEVIVSRGELIEIGGSFRIPEIMQKSGARLREVGTTNRTRVRDYESAISEQTRLLLRVHPSNFRIHGFTERPSLEDLVELGRRYSIPICEDLGSGCLFPADAAAVDEPSVVASLRSGLDLVCFSGDKLLGGPQAGIIAGRKSLLDPIRRNPLFRALRVDKLTLAALEVVVRCYLSGDVDQIPIWRMLRAKPEDLKQRAEALARRSDGRAVPMSLSSVVGGGASPETQLPSWGVGLNSGLTCDEVIDRLRKLDPPVIARIESGQVVLDLRTVEPGEDEILSDLIRRI